MKTKEKKNTIKEEVRSADEEVRELTDDELVQVSGVGEPFDERVPYLGPL